MLQNLQVMSWPTKNLTWIVYEWKQTWRGISTRYGFDRCVELRVGIVSISIHPRIVSLLIFLRGVLKSRLFRGLARHTSCQAFQIFDIVVMFVAVKLQYLVVNSWKNTRCIIYLKMQMFNWQVRTVSARQLIMLFNCVQTNFPRFLSLFFHQLGFYEGVTVSRSIQKNMLPYLGSYEANSFMIQAWIVYTCTIYGLIRLCLYLYFRHKPVSFGSHSLKYGSQTLCKKSNQ